MKIIELHLFTRELLSDVPTFCLWKYKEKRELSHIRIARLARTSSIFVEPDRGLSRTCLFVSLIIDRAAPLTPGDKYKKKVEETGREL
jgi:hypothetical protein